MVFQRGRTNNKVKPMNNLFAVIPCKEALDALHRVLKRMKINHEIK
jgi:hypothetical protein